MGNTNIKRKKNNNKRFYFYNTSNTRYIYITIAILCSLIPTKQQPYYQNQHQNNDVLQWKGILLADASTIIQDEKDNNIPSPSYNNNISPSSPITSRILKKVKLYTNTNNNLQKRFMSNETIY